MDKIDVRKDWAHTFDCGCVVTFLGSVFHRSSRMTPCVNHASREQTDLRTRMVKEAKGRYELAELGQPPTPFQDIAGPHGLPEDDRITKIGETAMTGKLVAFMTDSGPDDRGKAERYIGKLLARFPELRVVDQTPGPVANVVTVRICRKDTVAP